MKGKCLGPSSVARVGLKFAAVEAVRDKAYAKALKIFTLAEQVAPAVVTDDLEQLQTKLNKRSSSDGEGDE